MKALVTGSQGFIGSYICQELLDHGYEVVGMDNFSKYGEVTRRHDSHERFRLVRSDLSRSKSFDLLGSSYKPDIIVAGAAMIGGISYFHKYAYDLLATNERITANTFDYAIANKCRVLAISSSMVFENATTFPTPEDHRCFPPDSTYGFQKLAVEFFCKGAYEQYGLEYTIVRPFNCVGVGEEPSGKVESIGNVSMVLSHVVPDLIFRALSLSKDDPFPILGDGSQVRHYTNGKDIARGIRLAIEKGGRTDYNISSDEDTSVAELANLIWKEIHGNTPLLVSSKPYRYDVQTRSPDTSKAENDLGFKCIYSLEQSVREVIEYIRAKKDEIVDYNPINKSR